MFSLSIISNRSIVLQTASEIIDKQNIDNQSAVFKIIYPFLVSATNNRCFGKKFGKRIVKIPYRFLTDDSNNLYFFYDIQNLLKKQIEY